MRILPNKCKFIFIVLLACSHFLFASANKPSIEILFLNNRPELWPWTLEMFNTCREEIKNKTGIEVNYEYLSLSILEGDSTTTTQTIEWLQNKFENRFDLIISREYAPALRSIRNAFPDVPLILASVLQQGNDTLANTYTRIVELDYAKTLSTIASCFPNTKCIHVISGLGELDQYIRQKFQARYQDNYQNIDLKYSTGEILDTLVEKVKQTSKNDAIIFLCYSKDYEGKLYLAKDVVNKIAAVSPAPVFGISTTYLNNGIVGGYLHSSTIDGKRAAEIALKLLNHEKVDKVTLDTSYGVLALDWTELQKGNARIKDIPSEALFINKPENIFAQKPHLGIILMLLLGLLFITVLFLMLLRILQKKAHRKIKESDTRLKLALEHSHTSFFEVDFENNTLNYSERLITDLGYSHKEKPTTINQYKSFIHTEDITKFKQIFEGWEKNTSKEFDIEFRLKTKSADWQWIHSRGHIEGNRNTGKIKKIIGTSRNINEQKLLLELVRKEKDFNEQLIQLSPAFIVFISSDRKVVAMNQSMLQATGYRSEEVIQKDYLETFLPEQHRAGLKEIFDRHSRIDESLVSENPILTKTGDELLVEWHGKPVRKNNQLEGFIGIGIDITEKKHSAVKIKNNEERYKLLIENIDSSICFFDIDGKALLFNKKAAELLGGESTDYIGKDIRHIYGEEIGTKYLTRIIKTVEQNTKLEFEDEIQKDGKSAWILSSYLKMPEDTGYKNVVQIVGTDISEIKHQQKEIIKSLTELQIILANDPAFIIFKDTKNNIIKITDTVAKMTGLPKEKIEGQPSHKIYPDMADQYYKDDMEVINTGLPKKGIIEPLISSDGTRNWLLTDKIPYRNEKGEIAGIIVFSTDITKIKQSKEKLQLQNKLAETFIRYDSEEIFQKILLLVQEEFNSPFGYFGYINTDGDLVCPSMTSEINEKCSIANKTNTFPKETWNGLWGESLKNKTNLIKNTDLSTPAGHLPLHNAMVAVLCYKDELIGQIGLANSPSSFVEDQLKWLGEICNYLAPLLYTKIKETQFRTEIINAKERAEESDRLKTLFLNNMSHEVRTPMNGIIGFSDLLNEENLEPLQRKKYTSVIISSCHQLLNTIDNILEISALDLKRQEPIMQPLSLNQTLKELYTLFIPKKTNPDVELKLSLPLNDIDSWIVSDRSLLQKTLSYLIENALKYTNNGTINIYYSISSNQVNISVDDTGIGIAEE